MSGGIERQIAQALERFNKSALAKSEGALDAFSVMLKAEIQQELSQPGRGKAVRVRKVRFGRLRKDGSRLKLPARASDLSQAIAPR